MNVQSFGFSPAQYNQIVVFTDEEDFQKIVAANPDMTAIMGADDHTKRNFPGVFIAGIMANLHADKRFATSKNKVQLKKT